MRNITLSWFLLVSMCGVAQNNNQWFSYDSDHFNVSISVYIIDSTQKLFIMDNIREDSVFFGKTPYNNLLSDYFDFTGFENTIELIRYFEKRVKRPTWLNRKINRAYHGFSSGCKADCTSYFRYVRRFKAPKYMLITNENQSNKEFIKSGPFWTRLSSRKIIRMYEKSKIELEAFLQKRKDYNNLGYD